MSVLKNIFVFIGPPGSGKGSLAGLCVDQLGFRQLSTGNLFRKHISEQTELGRQIDFVIKSGKLVDDSIVAKLVEDWLIEMSKTSTSIVLDGYPRTTTQARFLNIFLSKQFPYVKQNVIKLEISDEEIIKRLSSRAICKKCQAVYSLAEGSLQRPKDGQICDKCGDQLFQRPDDDPEAIKMRLIVYHKHEQKILDFYKEIDREVIKLDVGRSLESIFKDFMHMFSLNDYNKK